MFQRTLNGSCLNGKFNWEKNSDDGAKVRNKQTNKQTKVKEAIPQFPKSIQKYEIKN